MHFHIIFTQFHNKNFDDNNYHDARPLRSLKYTHNSGKEFFSFHEKEKSLYKNVSDTHFSILNPQLSISLPLFGQLDSFKIFLF